MLCCPSLTTPAATQLPALPPLPAAPVQVRDGRIPMSTRHPHIPEWIGSKPRVLLINRKDMVPEADRAAWSRFFAERGHNVQWTHGNQGDGVAKVRCGGGGGGRVPANLPHGACYPAAARQTALALSLLQLTLELPTEPPQSPHALCCRSWSRQRQWGASSMRSGWRAACGRGLCGQSSSASQTSVSGLPPCHAMSWNVGVVS